MAAKRHDLSTESSRGRLVPRRERYWLPLGARGEELGYRRMPDGAGAWFARYRDAEGIRHYHALGTLEEFAPERRYYVARHFAREWIDSLKRERADGYTLRRVFEDYVAYLQNERSERVAQETRARVYRGLWAVTDTQGVPLLDKHIGELTGEDLRRWFRNLAASGGGLPRGPGSPAMTPVFAAVNRAFRAGKVPDNRRWRGLLRRKEPPDVRDLVLSDEQIERMLEHADPRFRDFLATALLTGCRPQEVARLRVHHLATHIGDDRKGRPVLFGQLTVPGPGRKERVITISSRAVSHLRGLVADKGAEDLLHTRGDGGAWEAEDWGEQMRRIRADARLPASAGLYSLRLKFIATALADGLPPETVAELCGTSTDLIERFHNRATDPAEVAYLLNRIDLPRGGDDTHGDSGARGEDKDD